MKVFFTASYRGKSELQTTYDKIVNTLRSYDVEVISREVLKYTDLLTQNEIEAASDDDEAHYLFVKKGIRSADAVIIEATYNAFSLGHESTLALVYNKPVLCLSTKEDYTHKIRHPKFFARKYTNVDDLELIVANFIRDMKNKHLSIRFNGFISSEQKTFLDWYSKKNKRTVSEVIRDLIDKEISENSDYFDDLMK